MSNLIQDGAHGLSKLPGERKIIYISAILGIILFAIWAMQKKGGVVSDSQGSDLGQDPTGGGGVDTYDPMAEIEAQKEVALAALDSDAALSFTLSSDSLVHDIGGSLSGKSGSGGLSIGGFSIGGGGASNKQDGYDLTTSNEFSTGFAATGLDPNEFQLLLQSTQAMVAASAAQQKATYDHGHDSLTKFKANPKVAKAPKGHHLETGPDGKIWWVKDGESIAA